MRWREDFIRDLNYSINKNSENSDITDLIFYNFDALLEEENFEFINEVLKKIDIEKLNSSNIRSLLVATSWAPPDKLPYRQEFYNKCWIRMINLVDIKKATRLIGNLI